MVSKVSNLETRKETGNSPWQQRSIGHSKLEIDFESHSLNVIWLVTIARTEQCDTISFVKLLQNDAVQHITTYQYYLVYRECSLEIPAYCQDRLYPFIAQFSHISFLHCMSLNELSPDRHVIKKAVAKDFKNYQPLSQV